LFPPHSSVSTVEDFKLGNSSAIQSFTVFSHSMKKRSRVPFLVLVRYEKGASGFFLVNDCGFQASKVLTHLPVNYATRKCIATSSMQRTGFLGIVTHRNTEAGIDVQVAWEDGLLSWESLTDFVKEADTEVRKYSRSHNLEHLKGWKSAIRRKATNIVVPHFVAVESPVC
jgi:hypothetical protein